MTTSSLANTASTPRYFPWYLTTAIVFSCGLILTVAGLRLWYFPTPTPSTAAAHRWSVDTLTTLHGSARPRGQQLQVTFDADGRAVVNLPLTARTAGQYNFIVVQGQHLHRLSGAVLLWQTQHTPDSLFLDAQPTFGPLHEAALPTNGWGGLWLPLHDLPDWSDQVARLALGLQGAPGQRIEIEQINMLPLTLTNLLRYTVAQWTSYQPWAQPAINAVPGVTALPAPRLRLPLVIAVVTCSAALYLLLVLAQRRWVNATLQWDWRVIATLVLIGWGSLDAPWQWQLQRQRLETQTLFAGYDNEQRRYRAEDGWLYELMVQIKQQLAQLSPPPESIDLTASPTTRILIASSDDYIGMRTAYHLLPYRVAWQRGSQELPAASLIQRGDVVVVIQSQQVNYQPAQQQLTWLFNAQPQQITVDLLFNHQLGSVFRVR